jgi:hypothetical protein
MFSVISWNVLYREYEETYKPDSKILKKYPNEITRVNDICNIVCSMIAQTSIICLQECSIDIYRTLSKKLSPIYDIFSINVRSNEYLITIAPKKFKFENDNIRQKPECSNALLSISTNSIKIINCHLIPKEYAKENVIKFLKSLSPETTKKLYIAGDFNECFKLLSRTLSYNYTIPYFGNTYRKRQIDHIIYGRSLDNEQFTVKTFLINTAAVSDHHMIQLTFINQYT